MGFLKLRKVFEMMKILVGGWVVVKWVFVLFLWKIFLVFMKERVILI